MRKKTLLTLMLILISIIAVGTINVSAETYGDLTYTISSGKASITDCNMSATSVEIPSQINGYPVTKIDKQAFMYCSKLTSINIPENVTQIGYNAFYGCSKLENIYWDANKVNEPASNDNIFSHVGESSDECNLIFGDSVETIPSYMFKDAGITTITIGKNVTSINKYAFDGCSRLTKVDVPKNVLSIGYGAFERCSSIKEMTLPFIGSSRGNSGTVDSVFGYIFNYTTSSNYPNYVLQTYSSTSSAYYHIPSSIKKVTITDETMVGYGAFYGCSNISDIIIEDTALAIGARAFGNHSNLLNVTIKSVSPKFADNSAFYNSSFVTLYGYSGSAVEDYATKNSIDFEPIAQAIKYEINGYIKAINNTLAVSVELSDVVTNECLHIALYTEGGQLVDYIIVPSYKAFENMNVVFKDTYNSAYAKVFLWKDFTSIQPLADAKRIDIER